MYTAWLTAHYLAGLARRGIRAVSSDRGALSLEWIVIAVALVVAAGVAAALFKSAISVEAKKLP